MIGRFLIVTLVACSLVVGVSGQASKDVTTQSAKAASIPAPKPSPLLPVLEVLNTSKLSGSLEFTGSCSNFSSSDFPEYSQLRAPLVSGASPLQTLRDIFASYPAMKITQDPDGIIRMTEKGVDKDILSVRIGHILFGEEDRGGLTYNANDALSEISSSPEVELFMKTHSIQKPSGFGVVSILGGGGKPFSWMPHLEGTLSGATFSEAMDHVLKTFPGIWVYENCPRTNRRNRTVFFHFYHLQNTVTG
jgi:hypothetical protein